MGNSLSVAQYGLLARVALILVSVVGGSLAVTPAWLVAISADESRVPLSIIVSFGVRMKANKLSVVLAVVVMAAAISVTIASGSRAVADVTGCATTANPAVTVTPSNPGPPPLLATIDMPNYKLSEFLATQQPLDVGASLDWGDGSGRVTLSVGICDYVDSAGTAHKNQYIDPTTLTHTYQTPGDGYRINLILWSVDPTTGYQEDPISITEVVVTASSMSPTPTPTSSETPTPITTTTTPVSTPTPPTPPDKEKHVLVLGDSYTSGEDAPPYLPGTDTKGDNCHRSYNSWGWQVAMRITKNNPNDIGFFACSGATTTTFMRDPGLGHEGSQISQIDQWHTQTGDTADVVLITLGGNDAKFANTVRFCFLLPDCTKIPFFESNRLKIVNNIAGRLRDAINALRDSSAVTSNTNIYFLAYPDPFAQSQIAPVPAPVGCPEIHHAPRLSLSPSEMTWLGEKWLVALNQVVSNAVAAQSTNNIHFVDDYTAFQGHTICLAKPDIHGLIKPAQSAFHPTALGYRAMASWMPTGAFS